MTEINEKIYSHANKPKGGKRNRDALNIGVGVYEKAVKLLAIRMHTVGELHQKLRIKGFKDDEILPVLRQLLEQRFLDDQKFAEIFVDNLKHYKDFGFYGIKAKLLGRQIPSDMAERALQEYFTLEDELVVARRLLGKLKKQGRVVKRSSTTRQGRDTYEQLARSLASKGFRNEVIRKVL